MGHDLELRVYGLKSGDYQTVDGWWRARHGHAFPEQFVPPLGVMCERGGEPLGVLWAYQPVGIGVAFLEYAVSKPGQNIFQLREVFGRILWGIEGVLQKQNYSLLRCFCEPVMSRAMRRFGFQGKNGNLTKIIA